MRRNNPVLVIALLLAIPAVLLGCSKGGSAPKTDSEAYEDTLKGFFSAYNSGNYDKCLTYMLGMSSASAGAREIMKSGLSAGHSVTGDIKVAKIENISIGQSSATADVTYTVQGHTLTQLTTLYKEGNSWKVDFENVWPSG